MRTKVLQKGIDILRAGETENEHTVQETQKGEKEATEETDRASCGGREWASLALGSFTRHEHLFKKAITGRMIPVFRSDSAAVCSQPVGGTQLCSYVVYSLLFFGIVQLFL